ncbi:MAG: HPr family phosphocarrier protein [Acidimicrobiia bacterium]|nr:HPr family phosphocarrier protein [Acidimicrobiia bacterium]NNF62924.1 HPr family phosphocarrier protein [Acidimicrobiia bacterium]
MNATVFGAGNIGRGLVGYTLDRAGFAVTFIDVDMDLVNALNEAGTYEVITEGSGRHSVAVAKAISAMDRDAVVAAIADSDIIATAVGGAILPVVAEPIAAGLDASSRDHVNVVACENLHPNSSYLKTCVAEHSESAAERAGFPDVVVDRIVPNPTNPLEMRAEDHFEFTIHGGEWSGPKPVTDDIRFVDDLAPTKQRKLWLVNGLHAATAWLGISKGHETIADAIEDGDIRSHVDSLAQTMVQVLAARHDEFTEEALNKYATSSMARFSDRTIPDPTQRVARNPLAKLAPDERILGPAREAEKLGHDLSSFAAVIAAGLALRDSDVEGAQELDDYLKREGWKTLISDGSSETEPLVDAVANAMPADEPDSVQAEVEITNPAGLHARPAAMLVERAKTFDSEIVIMNGTKKGKAKSIMSILALGASTGDVVTVTATGADADEAVAFVTEILQSTEEA